MTVTLDFVLYLVAFIFFVLAAVGVPGGRLNLVAAGWALFVLAFLV